MWLCLNGFRVRELHGNWTNVSTSSSIFGAATYKQFLAGIGLNDLCVLLTAGYLQDGTTEHVLGILEPNRRAVQMRLCGKLLEQLIAHRIEDVEEADDNIMIEGGIQLLATQLPLLACNANEISKGRNNIQKKKTRKLLLPRACSKPRRAKKPSCMKVWSRHSGAFNTHSMPAGSSI